MDNTRTVTDAKQQKIKIKKEVITSSMSTIVDRTGYVFFMKETPDSVET
jgi:Cft2 family RNA processing exonuclease